MGLKIAFQIKESIMKYILKIVLPPFPYRHLFQFVKVILDCSSEFNHFYCPFLPSPHHCYFTSQEYNTLPPIFLQNTNFMALFPFTIKYMCSVVSYKAQVCLTLMCFKCEHFLCSERALIKQVVSLLSFQQNPQDISLSVIEECLEAFLCKVHTIEK